MQNLWHIHVQLGWTKALQALKHCSSLTNKTTNKRIAGQTNKLCTFTNPSVYLNNLYRVSPHGSVTLLNAVPHHTQKSQSHEHPTILKTRFYLDEQRSDSAAYFPKQKKVKKRNHPSEHVHIGVTFKFPSIPWNPSWTPPQVLWRGACKPDNVQGSIKQKEHGSAEVGSGLATRGAEESREMAWVLLMNLSAFSFPHCGWGFQRARSGHALKQPEKQNG